MYAVVSQHVFYILCILQQCISSGRNISLAPEQILPSEPQKQVLYLPFLATRTPQIMCDPHPIRLHLRLCLDAGKKEGERWREEQWKTMAMRGEGLLGDEGVIGRRKYMKKREIEGEVQAERRKKSHFWWTAACDKSLVAFPPPVYITIYHQRAIGNRTSRASHNEHRTTPWLHWELHSCGWAHMVLPTNTSHMCHFCCPGSSRID